MGARLISDELVHAYGETDYVVFGPKQFTLKVGHQSGELQELYQSAGVMSAAFITAWNPYSCQMPAEENARRNAELEVELKKRGYTAFVAIGRDPSGKWPGEDSFFVLGISPEISATLGIQFEQNGYLWCGSNAVPELVLLR